MNTLKRGAHRALPVLLLASASAASLAGGLFFNSSAPANNATTRTNWLAAIGIVTGDYFEDFEGIPLDTDLHGVTGLLPGGLVIYDTSSAHHAYVRGSSTYFGGSNPIGTRGVAHNEQPYLELNLSAQPMDYVGGYDLDHTGGSMRVTYTDNVVETFTLDATGSGTNVWEFWGIYRNDMPQILKIQFDVGGDGEWGIDNLEFGPVPEPMTLAILGVGVAGLFGRRLRR